MQQVPGSDGVGRVGLGIGSGAPGVLRAREPGPEERHPEVQLDDRPLRVEPCQPVEPVDGAVRPPREGLTDPRLERAEARERASRVSPLSVGEELRRPAQRHRFGVAPHAQLERQRGHARARLRRGRGGAGRLGLQRDDPDDETAGDEGRCGCERDDAGERRHVVTVAAAAARHPARPGSRGARDRLAIFVKVMASYRELLSQARDEIDEISTREAHALLEAGDTPLFVDVRLREEWDEGHLPGAVHLPRNNLESRVEALVPDKERALVVYCESGSRSAFATKALHELGYEHAVNLAGGFADWKRNGFPFTTPVALAPAQRARYARHLMIPEVGEEGQQRLLESRVLLIGAGGLGSPASLYLAAAGVGRLGIIDPDVVDDSNLQRQIVHSTERLGEPKVESAKRTIEALNPDVEVVPFRERLDSENVERILAHGWDVIVDGTDNFPTRYLVNDASVWHEIPVVHGSIYRFEGQVTVFHPGNGPCYRCLYPSPPPPELAPSCAEGGVLGVLPGIVGSLQASEALKLVLGVGETLAGRLLLFDALATTFDEVAIRRNPDCPVCGDSPTITEYVDYVEFCSGAAVHAT